MNNYQIVMASQSAVEIPAAFNSEAGQAGTTLTLLFVGRDQNGPELALR